MKKFFANHLVEFIGFIFTLVAVILIAVGVFCNIKSQEFMKDAIAVEGRIVSIETSYTHNDETNYDVFVSYELDGKEYNHVPMDFYSTGMYEGQELTLYVNPDYPGEVKTRESDSFFRIFYIAFGGFFALIGLPMLIIPLVRKRGNKQLLENGQHVYAQISSIELNTSVSINGRHPYRVFCSYTNPSDGYIYKFKSENLMFDPNDSYKVGDNVDVYIDPDNLKRYYVNVIDKMAEFTRDYT